MSRNSKDQERDERRRARRRPILDTFLISAQLPALGPYRLEVEDLSEVGIGLRLEEQMLSEVGISPPRLGETLELKLYLNTSLFIPLRIRVARALRREDERQILVGGDFEGSSEGAVHAVRSFLGVLDLLVDAVRMDPVQSPGRLPSMAPKTSAKTGPKSASKPARRSSKKA
jgi:hypothetical protein